MEAYAKALLIGIPFFLVLIIVELLYGLLKKDIKYRTIDTISSLASGISNILKDTLGLAIVLISYPFILKHIALFKMESTFLVYFIAFIALDFGNYWQHRLAHKVNIFWNKHLIHHSSEEFNLACALRQPVAGIFGYFALFLIPAAILGVPNEVIALLAPIHLFAQFWYHTQHIGKLGFLEYIIVTPSQHRVHHAINPEYIDKNLAAIFCVWDRMFGTFQEELKEVPPVYGVLKPVKTWNPVLINFQHFWRLCQDAWRTRKWIDKVRIWFMPTGWRPDDVKSNYQMETVKNPYSLNKYDTSPQKKFTAYAIFQLLSITFLMLYMFANFENLDAISTMTIGLFLFAGIFGFTSLLDYSKWAGYWEIIRASLGLILLIYALIYHSKIYFGAFTLIFFGFYNLITLISTLYFMKYEVRFLKKHKQ
ncbi:MAG: sterol desaturase family protein [Bacteroidota bacterium]